MESSNDQARRDRMAKAIYDTFVSGAWNDIADAAIAAYNEPEPTPQLLLEMADAIDESHDKHTEAPLGLQPEEYHCLARAALGVVVRKLNRCWESSIVADDLGIPESLVKEMLDTTRPDSASLGGDGE